MATQLRIAKCMVKILLMLVIWGNFTLYPVFDTRCVKRVLQARDRFFKVLSRYCAQSVGQIPELHLDEQGSEIAVQVVLDRFDIYKNKSDEALAFFQAHLEQLINDLDFLTRVGGICGYRPSIFQCKEALLLFHKLACSERKLEQKLEALKGFVREKGFNLSRTFCALVEDFLTDRMGWRVLFAQIEPVLRARIVDYDERDPQAFVELMASFNYQLQDTLIFCLEICRAVSYHLQLERNYQPDIDWAVLPMHDCAP